MHHGKVSKEIAAGLIELKRRIELAKIPSSKIDETLNIATWNIRQFGSAKRTEAAIHYIAEILGQFDLVGIVELKDNLKDLKRVLDILGPYWKVVYSDMIPDPGGNRERIGFIYDQRAVIFCGLAAEANPPRTKKGSEYFSKISWWRSPYFASFRAGNFDFVVMSVHTRWGNTEEERLGELELLAEWLNEKKKEKYNEDRDLIVMGDFNIPKKGDKFFNAITSCGLVIPNSLLKEDLGSNLVQDKRYDQIFIYPNYPENFTNNGGILNFYMGDIDPLFKGMKKEAFTHQISDHFPLWIQIKTNIDSFLLEQIIRN